MSTAVINKPSNGQHQSNEEKEIAYVPIGEKEEIKLSISIIEKFLCVKTRNGKIASREDIVKFMMLCKAQGLNPWVNDAYLVGYDTNDGPKFQLITAHQSLLKRAELSDNYDGLEAGVCVMTKAGDLRERPGSLVLTGETLIGGWARAHRSDRKFPSYDSLSLSTYSTGKSRWSIDPAGMIIKCAQAAVLREAFPSTLAQMYCREELERQIENGERSQCIEHTEVATGSKSDQLASILSKRIASQETEAVRESSNVMESADSTEQPSEEKKPETPEPKQPSGESQFEACVKYLDEKKPSGVKNIYSDPAEGLMKYSLPNGETLTICDGAKPSPAPGFRSVDTRSAKALQDVRDIVEIAIKTRV